MKGGRRAHGRGARASPTRSWGATGSGGAESPPARCRYGVPATLRCATWEVPWVLVPGAGHRRSRHGGLSGQPHSRAQVFAREPLEQLLSGRHCHLGVTRQCPWITDARPVICWPPHKHNPRSGGAVLQTSVTRRDKPPLCRSVNRGPGSWDGGSGHRCRHTALLVLQRIRTPLTPEILKSSMSWTMVSLLGSLGSLSRTWSKATTNERLHPGPHQQLPAAPPAHLRPRLRLPGLLPQVLPGRASWSLPLWELRPAWEPGAGRVAPHTFQELDLIHGGLRVMPRALHHFQGHEALAPATPSSASAAGPARPVGASWWPQRSPGVGSRLALGPGGWWAEGALTGYPSRARRWRSGPSPACAPRGTAH